MKAALGKALAHMADSKTYVVLIILAVIAFITCIIAAALFGQELWDRFFDLLMGETGAAATRAATVDGMPKMAAAWRDPNSNAANPPPAVTQPQNQIQPPTQSNWTP